MKGIVLVVEDELKVAAVIAEYLTTHGYQPQVVADGTLVAGLVRELAPVLVILDLMLPGRDGLDVCRELRAFSDIPIIMQTARIDEIDRLIGLEAGADDYVCKPVSPRELVARVNAVLRRTQSRVAAAGVQLDHDRVKAYVDGVDCGLTAVEFALLAVMAASPGRIFSRQRLMDSMYGDDRTVSDRTIDSHIKKLRRKLAQSKPGFDPLETLYGAGYRFAEP